MNRHATPLDRRSFLQKSTALTTGLLGLGGLGPAAGTGAASPTDNMFVIGPTEGYSPQIGTLVSMLQYNRQTIIQTVNALTMTQLDHLHDAHANTIGALVMHLGAVDKFYQINTFEGRQEFSEAEKKQWDAAMELGDLGRKMIKGREVKHYLDAIEEVRQKTLAEFKKRDDKWLMAVDPQWSKPDKPLNTYWKWFHVCEHEANHRGQMTWLKSRLPGAKPGKD